MGALWARLRPIGRIESLPADVVLARPEDVVPRPPERGAVGIGFIDVLFGLVVGPVFIAVVGTSWDDKIRLTQLILVLVVVTFSWVGFHKTRAFDPLDVSFTSPTALQYIVDVAIVGLYFALAVNAQAGTVDAFKVEATLLAVVFGLYLVWDLLGSATLPRNTEPQLMAHARIKWSLVFALGFGGYAFVMGSIWHPTNWDRVVLVGAIIVLALFCYRIGQQRAEDNIKKLFKARRESESPPNMIDRIDWEPLLAAAEQVVSAAYAPYSTFHVGAAVLTDDGAVYSGCNVENASYGLTICAERSAIFAAVAAHPNQKVQIRAVAIVTDPPIAGSPCGACRQVMAEFGPDATVSYVSSEGRVERTVGELLPDPFIIE